MGDREPSKALLTCARRPQGGTLVLHWYHGARRRSLLLAAALLGLLDVLGRLVLARLRLPLLDLGLARSLLLPTLEAVQLPPGEGWGQD